MSRSAYRIVDEPTRSAWRDVAVRPHWPLLTFMLGGTLAGWSWFAVNSVALGSPTRGREIGLLALGLAGAAAIVFGADRALVSGPLSPSAGPYILLVLTLWKLGLSYSVMELRTRTAHLHEHFGRRMRNGGLVVVAALLTRGAFESFLRAHGLTFLLAMFW